MTVQSLTRPIRALVCALSLMGAIGCASGTQQTSTTQTQIHTLRETYNNIHVIQANGQLVLVDAGLEENAPVVATRLRDMGLDPAKISAVIVTHGHADHAGGARYFREQFGATIIAGAGDRALLSSGTNGHLCPTDSIAESRLEDDQNTHYPPYDADVWIDTTTALRTVVAIDGSITPVPGHTEGSLVVVLDDVAFVGDLFRGSIVGSSATTHFYMCDLEDNTRDIRALLDANPGVETFLTGHFGPVSRSSVEAYLDDRANP